MRSGPAVWSVLLAVCLSGACQAAAETNTEPPPSPAAEPAFPVVTAATGSDHDMPLRHAVAAIVPRDYAVRSESIMRLYPSPVSWRGGSDWTEVLRQALSPYPQVLVFIDKQSKTVTLRLRGERMVAAAAPRIDAPLPNPKAVVVARPAVNRDTVRAETLPARPSESPVATSAVAAVAVTAPVPAPPLPTWQIRIEDRSLRSLFARWSQAAGWQLSWEVPVDYSIEASATLSGSLESAVETVVKSLFNVDVPMRVVFYKGNKVLRVVAKGAE